MTDEEISKKMPTGYYRVDEGMCNRKLKPTQTMQNVKKPGSVEIDFDKCPNKARVEIKNWQFIGGGHVVDILKAARDRLNDVITECEAIEKDEAGNTYLDLDPNGDLYH